jgi:hypothetical protein
MAIRTEASTERDHNRLEKRQKPSQMDPALLEAADILKGGKPVRLYYDTDAERNNIARQMGRLAARNELTVDIRYGEENGQKFVSVNRGEEPYVPKPRAQSGDGRRRPRVVGPSAEP